VEIHQLLPSLNDGDAVGNHAIDIQRVMRSWGYESEIFVGGAQEKVAHLCHPIRKHGRHRSPENMLIYHHCIGGTDAFKYFLTVPDRKILLYHNITPAHYFAEFNQEVFEAAKEGRRELDRLKDVVCTAWGVSAYNCEELKERGFRNVRVLPIAINLERLDSVAPNAYVMDFFDDGYQNLLFVGRITPNKRQDQLIRVFAYFQKEIERRSRLFIVGGYGGMEPYCNHLLRIMGEKKTGNIILSGHVSLDELVAYYRLADVFVCLSEHEGFCVPLLESMHFDVPVVALDSTGVTATLGGAGILVKDSSEVTVSASLTALLSQKEQRDAIVEKQRIRLHDFDKAEIDSLLHHRIQELIVSAQKQS